MMVADGTLERVSRGIYVSVDTVEDEMFAMQSKYSKLIYSHETALFIHNLTDRTPFEYSASVPSGYKVVSNISDKFKIYYIKKELHDLGVIKAKTTFGNIIRVYSIEKTICDLFRSKNQIDIQIFNEGLKRFIQQKSVDYLLLMEYAKKLKVDTAIQNYMQIIL